MLSGLLAAWCVFGPAAVAQARVTRSDLAGTPAQRSGVAAAKSSASGGINNSIANAVAGMAAKSAAGFLLNKVGLGALVDGTQANFAAVQTRLDGISTQITALQKSVDAINGELQAVELHQYTIPLEGYVNTITTLYDNKFKPTVVAAINYAHEDRAAIADGKTCADVQACSDALTALDYHRKLFFDAESAVSNEELNLDIHKLLMPDTTRDSALISFGKFLMAGVGSTGFLTSADSDRLFAFYDYFSEYEALAVWMEAEYGAVVLQDQPQTFIDFLYKNISGPCPAPKESERCGYFDLERRQLPARIPADTVISLPANSTSRTTTQNQSMWLWDAKLGLNQQWDPSKPGPGNVSTAIQTIRTTAVDGFSDWQVPSKQSWDGLFTGRATTFASNGTRPYTGITFLSAILPNTAVSPIRILQAGFLDANHPYVWTNDVRQGKVACVQNALSEYITIGYVTNDAHTALPVSAGIANYPGQFPLTSLPNINMNQVVAPHGLNTAQAMQYCSDTVAAAVTNGAGIGQLIVTRMTTENYMPVPVPLP
jgi:hypothetical protein